MLDSTRLSAAMAERTQTVTLCLWLTQESIDALDALRPQLEAKRSVKRRGPILRDLVSDAIRQVAQSWFSEDPRQPERVDVQSQLLEKAIEQTSAANKVKVHFELVSDFHDCAQELLEALNDVRGQQFNMSQWVRAVAHMAIMQVRDEYQSIH